MGRITLAELREVVADDMQLVEVLDEEEYDWAHLPGAIRLSLDDIGTEVPPSISTGKRVVVYCNDFL